MSLSINILEGLISGWTLSELCDINQKRLFILIITVFTFFSAQICDYFQMNSWPLLLAYLFGWFTIISIFKRQSYIYNFFIVLICNYIINLSVILPIIFHNEIGMVFASLCAKTIHFCLAYLFVLYRRKYSHVENKYWIPVLFILTACMIIMEDNIFISFSDGLNVTRALVIVMSLSVGATSLFFFWVIEMFAKEKKDLIYRLEREKYKSISYSLVKHANDELTRLQHEMLYRIMLIRSYLEINDTQSALDLTKSYMLDISKYSRVITTGNEIFDVLFSIKTIDLKYDLVKCLNMSENDYYNNLEFINLILDLLSIINEKITVYLDIEEIEKYCVIKFSSISTIFNHEAIMKFLADHKDDYVTYSLNDKTELYSFKINVKVCCEDNL